MGVRCLTEVLTPVRVRFTVNQSNAQEPTLEERFTVSCRTATVLQY